jgi:glycosyltransferase involved in cell wall biosynthesis
MVSAVDAVTILVLSYNQAAFLPAAIESALRQTIGATVLVVDDGSTDDSVEVARNLGCDVEARAHEGALRTFRAACDMVETPFFIRLDGDDVLAPTYVAETFPVIAGDPDLAFVYTGMHLFGAIERYEPALPFSRSRFRWYNYAHAASITRTSAYQAVGGYDPAFSNGFEDWALWCALVANGWKAAGVDLPLLHYRQYPRVNAGQPGHRSRNAAGHADPRAAEEARWRIARKHVRYYGLVGWGRLLISRALLRLGLRAT